MKKDIHPNYHEIIVEMTDGSTFTTRSTWGNPGDKMKLDIDSKSHPAYVEGKFFVKAKGQVEKFMNKFDMDFLGGGSSQDNNAEDAQN